MAARKSKLMLMLLTLPLAGAAFWYCDGMILLEPWLGSQTVVLKQVAAAERSAPAHLVESAVVHVDPTRRGGSLSRFGSWDGSGSLRQVFLPSVPSWEQDELLSSGGAEAALEDRSSSSPDANRGGQSVSADRVSMTSMEDLPLHEVTVVMLSAGEHVAVVDGVVVNVGDVLTAGEIVNIDEDAVVVRSSRGLIDYMMGSSRAQTHRGASRAGIAEDGR
ncbi:MAG: hypothetical protein ACI9EF_000206 [Pseudohongiellaceae bacterium]|jgi:hypothetical protein